MKKISLILSALLLLNCAFAQSDTRGPGRAILFDGVDDYIDLGNIYDDIALPITISAWVYIEPHSDVTQYPIFDSQDNSSIYNGFTFVGSTLPHIGFTIGDGKGGNNPAFRRSRAGYFEELGKWVYMTAVAKSGYDIHTYLNGHDVSGDYQGSSSSPMNSYSPAEVAKIGYLFSNGLLFRFKGIMDEVRIWNRARTEQEIRESMCRRLTGTEPGLIGYWNFDETGGDMVMDGSPNRFNGTLKGNPQRVFSGAPVGDQSSFLYTASWTAKELSHNDVVVSNIQGTPFGVHIYSVNNAPSQTDGLDQSSVQSTYYGIFLADDSGNNTFDFSLTNVEAACDVFERKDNSVASWNRSSNFAGVQGRIEIIPSSGGEDFQIDLGADANLCDLSGLLLDTKTTTAGKTFLWNTGETTPQITVMSTGEYSVRVSGSCTTKSDTIFVSFASTPPTISLGDDEELCDFKPKVLAVELETDEFEVTWQDGSSEEYFLVESFGTYWVNVANSCGTVYDSITFTERKKVEIAEQYNFISPDTDDDLNQYLILHDIPGKLHLTVFNRWGKEVYQNTDYDHRWDGGNLPSGVYFYIIAGECFEPYKGTVTIMR